MEGKRKIILPAEWHPQSGVMMTWPHLGTDWRDMLDEVENCFINIACEISKREKLIIVCPHKSELRPKLRHCLIENILVAELPSNDTWARDHGPVTVFIDDKPVLYDFTFNGWGGKFKADLDNQITGKLYSLGLFSEKVSYSDKQSFVLEGGSIESDGQGTLLTTQECLCSGNRNSNLNKEDIENYLNSVFDLQQVLWLTSGYLAGDDTDGHIDTLARFCNESTIAYVKCDDPSDEHYETLLEMEQELKSFKTVDQKSYDLIPLPMADPVFKEGKRLPATYANFLIINSAVLLPFYNSHKDKIARNKLQNIFPDREIIGIDSRSLISQHGSLHCVTMQFPIDVID